MKTKIRTVGLMLGAAALVLGVLWRRRRSKRRVVEGSDQKAVKVPAGRPGADVERPRTAPPRTAAGPTPAPAAAPSAAAGSASGGR